MVAMMCNLAAAILCSVQSVRDASAGGSGLPALLVICSEHGTMTLPADDGTPAPAEPSKSCQFCLAAASLALAAIFVVLATLLSPAARLGFCEILLENLADALRRAGLGSRAPPRFA